MSMNNDIAWDAKGNQERCEYNSQTVANYARKFLRGHWSFLWPGSGKKWYGTYSDKPDGSWDKTAENMMKNFSDSGHPKFRASSVFERGELRSKGGGRKSFRFNGSDKNIELLLHTVISANLLRVYRAIHIYATSYPKASGLRRNLMLLIIWIRRSFLLVLPLQKLMPMHSNGEN